ncbi:hypothetical protein BCEN4_330020 [Burkholderia cenocepacia]|nr:hypothetical protein BCEN4_330020 [Burkholderia cenocepacia]
MRTLDGRVSAVDEVGGSTRIRRVAFGSRQRDDARSRARSQHLIRIAKYIADRMIAIAGGADVRSSRVRYDVSLRNGPYGEPGANVLPTEPVLFRYSERRIKVIGLSTFYAALQLNVERWHESCVERKVPRRSMP